MDVNSIAVQLEDVKTLQQVTKDAVLNMVKQSEKTDFFMGTPAGSYILNILAGLSLAVAAFVFSFMFPDKQAMRKAFCDLCQKMQRRFWSRSAEANVNEDDEIVHLARRCMPVDLEQGLLLERLIRRQHWQRLMLSNDHFRRFFSAGAHEQGTHHLLPTHRNSNTMVQINFCFNDNVSTERAQNFMHGVLHRGRHRSFDITPDPQFVLLGSKLIRAHFNAHPISEEQEEQIQAEDAKDLAEAAMMLDENATIQIGGLSLIHRDEEQGLTMSSLSDTDVPILSSARNFEGRALVVQGCYLTGCGFKASTRSQCTNLLVFKRLELRAGLEAVFARIPQANELFLDDHTYIYAYKSILCGTRQIIVRSELMRLELIKTRPPAFIRDERLKITSVATFLQAACQDFDFTRMSFIVTCGTVVTLMIFGLAFQMMNQHLKEWSIESPTHINPWSSDLVGPPDPSRV